MWNSTKKLLFLKFPQLLLGSRTLLFLLFIIIFFLLTRKKEKKKKQNSHIFKDISKPVFQKLIAVMVDDICHSSIQTLNLLRFTHFNPGHLREHHPSHICQRRHKASKSLVGFCSIQKNGVKGSSTIGETAVRKREKTSQERSMFFFRFFGDFNKSEGEDAKRTGAALLSQASGMCAQPFSSRNVGCPPAMLLGVPGPHCSPISAETLLSLEIPAAGIHSTALMMRSKALGVPSLKS